MLQISSGKFYSGDNEIVEHQRQHPIYSNYSWVQPIQTCVAVLVPADFLGSCSTYVINYTEKFQKSGAMIGTSGVEIVEQFKLLCSFGLRAFFDIERRNVEHYCMNTQKATGDLIPSAFIPRFFESSIHGNPVEIDSFIRFIDKVIGMRRQQYNVLMDCIDNFIQALYFVDHNIDLAYSMLVFSLEALSQHANIYVPEWSDYENRNLFDTVFKNIEPSSVDQIKAIILKDKHLKLQKRFVSFVLDHTSDDYFLSESTEIRNPIKKSDLPKALKNAYQSRSNYTHVLEKLDARLKTPHIDISEVFFREKLPYLRIRGLARLTYHVITNFINEQDCIEKEDYNFEAEIPGVIYLPPAPELWLGKINGFEPSDSINIFANFLICHLNELKTQKRTVDFSSLLSKIETMLPIVNAPSQKRAILAIYYLYNTTAEENTKRNNWEQIYSEHEKIFDECSIESMLLTKLTKQKWPWTTNTCVACFNEYYKKKYWKNELQLPSMFEALIMCGIATAYLTDRNDVDYHEWLNKAKCDLSGSPKIQEYLIKCEENNEPVNELLFNIV